MRSTLEIALRVWYNSLGEAVRVIDAIGIEKNIWRSAGNKRLTEAMRLCGCDERFFDGRASDYECLCEFLRVAERLRGHEALDSFLETVNSRMEATLSYDELIAENATWIWTGGEKGRCAFGRKNNDIIVEKYNFEKMTAVLNDIKKEHSELEDFVAELKKDICENKMNVFARLSGKNFAAPNPYLAKRIYDNCQKIQDDVLICQILCEIMLDKNCRKTQIYLDTDGNYEYVRQYVEFLDKHRMSARISVMVRAEDNVDNILEACRSSTRKCFVTPCILVTNNDTCEKLSEFRSRLSKIYPIGMLEVIE